MPKQLAIKLTTSTKKCFITDTILFSSSLLLSLWSVQELRLHYNEAHFYLTFVVLFQGYVTVFEKCIRQPYIYVVLTSFIDISTLTREQSKPQVLAEYPVVSTVLQMTENSLHPYHSTVYVFILVSLWKENFMASSDKLWRKARGRHQASMSHVFLLVIMLTTLFGTRRGVSHCSHRSQRIWQKKNLLFNRWSSLNFWRKFVWRWSSKFFNFPTVFNTVSGACFFYLFFLYCIFFFFAEVIQVAPVEM